MGHKKPTKQFTVRYRATCVYEVTIDAASHDEASALFERGEFINPHEIECVDTEVIDVKECR